MRFKLKITWHDDSQTTIIVTSYDDSLLESKGIVLIQWPEGDCDWFEVIKGCTEVMAIQVIH